MRDIKFRVWDPELKTMEMVGALDWDSDYNLSRCDIHNHKMYRGLGGDYDFIVMQYTGSNDFEYPKSNMIFEGDIVSAYIHGDLKSPKITNQVTFKNGSFYWGNWTWDEFLNKFRFILVVGNVFENPKLLEVSK